MPARIGAARLALNDGFQFLSVGAAAVALNSAAAFLTNQVHQRDTLTGGGQGKGQGSIKATVNPASTTDIYARVRSTADGTTIYQSLGKVATAVATGAQTLTITGVDAAARAGYLDLSSNGTTWENGTVPFLMGDCIAIGGQSLAARMFNRISATDATITTLGITPSAYGFVFATYTESVSYEPAAGSVTWQQPATGATFDAPFLAELVNRYIAAEGVACGVLGHSVGATALKFWQGNANGNTKLQAVLAAAGGKWRRQLWYQGQSDALYGVTPTSYQKGLATLMAGSFANNAFAGTVLKYLGSHPIYNSSTFGTANQANRVRAGGKAFAVAAGWTYIDASDTDTADGVHESAAGGVILARNLYRGMEAGNLGPLLTSAIRSGQTITATLSNSGTALAGAGSWWQRFKAYNTGSVRSQWTISSGAIVDANTVTLTLSTDPGVGQAIDLYLSWPNEGTNTVSADMLRDNVVDGDGITAGRAIRPNTTAIAVAAPTPGGATNAPPTGIVGPVTVANLTMTSPTYTSGEVLAGFGTALNGGRGQTASNALPFVANSGMTTEFFFQLASNPSALAIIASFISNSVSYYVNVSTAGVVQLTKANGASASGMTLTTGKIYHMAVQFGPSGSKLFVKNITDNTADVLTINDATAWDGVPSGMTYGFLTLNGSFNFTSGVATIFHVALWDGERWTTSHTAPSTPLVGNEAGLIALHRLNGDGTDAVKSA